MKGTPGQVAVGQKALSVADPFAAPRTITFRAVGYLATTIESVTFDAVYSDPQNSYTQRKTVVLTAAMPFHEWSFPVFDDTVGSVTYTGTIARKDGTSEAFGPTTTTASVIEGGDVIRDFLEVTIQTALIDWAKVKAVLVNLAYTDPDNDVVERKALLEAPDHYGVDLSARLVDTYVRLGKQALAEKRVGAALEDFDRVL